MQFVRQRGKQMNQILYHLIYPLLIVVFLFSEA